MPPDPTKYISSEKEIKKLLKLKDSDLVYAFGYENFLDENQLREIQRTYDMTALFFRLRPDWLIRKDGHWFFLEKKETEFAVESTQLFFNKILSKIGINVYYLINEKLIPVEEIQFNEIEIPPRYSADFIESILPFILEFFSNIKYRGRPATKGSGDPFTRLQYGLLRKI